LFPSFARLVPRDNDHVTPVRVPLRQQKKRRLKPSHEPRLALKDFNRRFKLDLAYVGTNYRTQAILDHSKGDVKLFNTDF
jgi:hypothetical protein